MVNGIYRTVEEIIAPFPSTGNFASAPAHTWRAAVPDHPGKPGLLVASARVGEGGPR